MFEIVYPEDLKRSWTADFTIWTWERLFRSRLWLLRCLKDDTRTILTDDVGATRWTKSVIKEDKAI
jgi:hypothetical protein